MALAIVLMGVSGCGKTSIGQALSAELGWSFFEGDDFHLAENVEKMTSGMPLNDDERTPWLESLHDLITEQLHSETNTILTCSALKAKYRQYLREENDGVVFVFLKGDYDLIRSRLHSRNDHFMKPEMLISQFDTLEIPLDALQLDVDQPIKVIVQEIIEFLGNEYDLENN
ncbi:MAG: gluconokinase [Anaerolineales bacterium]